MGEASNMQPLCLQYGVITAIDKSIETMNRLEIIDVMRDQLHESAKDTTDDVLSFLKLKEIFGDLIHNKLFTDLYSGMVRQIHTEPDIRKHMESMLKKDIL